ncbi:MAG: arsenite methyltransferase [Candidatus Saganbacteria bacterium]|nr:arsenite methyltransferase [Candidatus Saganbacteria bacterium]
MKKKRIKETVKRRYGEIASKGLSCCGSCSCDKDAAEQSKEIGYSSQELKNIPQEAVMGLGCGNPSALADLKAGEAVLDLGSGAGIDAFLAARKVGGKGRVIGVDMTPQMIKRAKANARKGKYENVEFRLGEIEALPVEDSSIDVILSNCVINLSPDKKKVYKEAYRVLKPGGRILISDIVTNGKLPKAVMESFVAWAECIAGGMEKQAYLKLIKESGFRKVEVVGETIFDEPGLAKEIKGKIVSLQVKAYK